MDAVSGRFSVGSEGAVDRLPSRRPVRRSFVRRLSVLSCDIPPAVLADLRRSEDLLCAPRTSALNAWANRGSGRRSLQSGLRRIRFGVAIECPTAWTFVLAPAPCNEDEPGDEIEEKTNDGDELWKAVIRKPGLHDPRVTAGQAVPMCLSHPILLMPVTLTEMYTRAYRA